MAEELTDKIVEGLQKPATGNRVVYDVSVKGFGVRVTSGGAKAYILNYRIEGRERRITIGSLPEWKIKAARDQAKILKRQIDVGLDPMQAREEARKAQTMGELYDQFEKKALPSRRPKTQADYRDIIRLYLRPEWGNLKIPALKHSAVATFHREIMKRAPVRANRVIALLSTIFVFAMKEGLATHNPTKGVERHDEDRRERYLSPAEIGRLAEALTTHPEKASADAIKILLLTGARRGEVLKAEWSEFDLDDETVTGTWTKPSGHTKQKKLHKIPLSPPVVQILTEMKKVADKENSRRIKDKLPAIPHLFPGKSGKPLQDIKHSWATICENAKLGQFVQVLDEKGKLLRDETGKPVMKWKSDTRLHDLRHSFASVLVSRGLSLPIVGALLGHTQPKTTARYAHLHNDALMDATSIMADVFSGAKKPAEQNP